MPLLKFPEAVMARYKPPTSRERKYNAYKYDPEKPTLAELKVPVLVHLFGFLDAPSQVSLALVSKFYAEVYAQVSSKYRINLDNTPDKLFFRASAIQVLQFGQPKTVLGWLEMNDISTLRQTLVQLKPWFGWGKRLCWICCKYSSSTKDKWHRLTTYSQPVEGNTSLYNLATRHTPEIIYGHHGCCASAGDLHIKWNQMQGAKGMSVTHQWSQSKPAEAAEWYEICHFERLTVSLTGQFCTIREWRILKNGKWLTTEEWLSSGGDVTQSLVLS